MKLRRRGLYREVRNLGGRGSCRAAATHDVVRLNRVGRGLALPCVLLLFVCRSLPAQDAASFNTERRLLWTTSRVTGTPDPPAPYRTVNAFPNLKFDEPVDMTSAPGTERLFVAERFGRLVSFDNDTDAEQVSVLLDMRNGQDVQFLGLVFHPEFETNGEVFVTLQVHPDDARGMRVVRFRAKTDETMPIDPDSQEMLIEWPSGGHTGGCLKFGPDGMLYICTGDSSGIADQLLTGQNIGDLSASILRIDVDHRSTQLPYAIPPDNPFVGVDGAREEVWAYGLRQPWKIAFDSKTGDLWTGNVGQDLWEQIYLIERGGNYGWSVMEGGHAFRPDRERGPSPFKLPVVEHNHAEFRSVTGGFVYHGTRLPKLTGAYIYGDYDTGKIWMFRYDRDTKQVAEHRELVDSALRLVGFGEDHAGELFLVDHMSGLISRLEKNLAANSSTDFPRLLSETGLFSSVSDHTVSTGVIPYDVIAPQWTDGTTKQRFLALPGDSQIELDGITYPQPAPGAPHGWKFPDGTVAFETISIEMESGNPASRRRLETRLLHYEQLLGSESVGDQLWRGYTYLWNDEQTDAVLLEDPPGRDLPLSIQDPSASEGSRTQTWHVPGRAECMVCHNMAAKYVLGVSTLQMNRDFDYGRTTKNQLRVFDDLGLFTAELPESPHALPSLDDYRDATEDVSSRARSYLHANCSHCHRKWGGGNGDFLLLATVTQDEMGITDERPKQGGFLIPDARVLAPGDPYRSVLFYRISKLGPGRMPRLGSNLVDHNGLNLIHDWIAQLGESAVEDDTTRTLTELTSEVDRAKRIDELLATTTGALQLMRAADSESLSPAIRTQVVQRATYGSADHIRDLFERFLPEEQRPKRLGTVIRPETILALDGDAERGKALFLTAVGVQCRNCHKVNGQGADVGPDLSDAGRKYPERSRLLDTILNPSREIDPKYQTQMVLTTDGKVATGILVSRNERQIVLKTEKGMLTTFMAKDVEELVPQQQSMMPDLLLRDMTAAQVADLVAFLSGLTAETPAGR